jgi:hypothetical protein
MVFRLPPPNCPGVICAHKGLWNKNEAVIRVGRKNPADNFMVKGLGVCKTENRQGLKKDN